MAQIKQKGEDIVKNTEISEKNKIELKEAEENLVEE